MNEPQDPAPTPRRSRDPVRRPSRRSGRQSPPTRRRRALRKRAQLDAGAVIARTFALCGRQFAPFLVLALLATLPSLLFEYVTYKPVFDSLQRLSDAPETLLSSDLDLADYQRGTPLNLLSSLLRLMGLLFLQGAIIYMVVEHLRSGRPSLLRAISISSSRLLSMLGIALMLFVILNVILLALVFMAAVFVGATTDSGTAVVVISVLGMLVGVSVVLTRFSVSIPVAVIERMSSLKAMARSDTLTAGVRSVILGTGLVVYVVPLVVAQVVMRSWMNLESWKAAIGVAFAAQVVGGILMAVFCAVVYHDARVSSEGIETADLARVFD